MSVPSVLTSLLDAVLAGFEYQSSSNFPVFTSIAELTQSLFETDVYMRQALFNFEQITKYLNWKLAITCNYELLFKLCFHTHKTSKLVIS